MKYGILEGQISILDLPTEDPKIIINTLNNIINLYSLSCSRIVKTHSEV